MEDLSELFCWDAETQHNLKMVLKDVSKKLGILFQLLRTISK